MRTSFLSMALVCMTFLSYAQPHADSATVTLLRATDTLTARLSGDKKDNGQRTVILTLRLSGAFDSAHSNVRASFHIPPYMRSLSTPSIEGKTTFTLTKQDFGPGMSPILQIPLIIQLTPVDSLPSPETVPILIDDQAPTAHILVIRMPVTPKTPPPAPSKAKEADPPSPSDLLLSCYKGNTFRFQLAPAAIFVTHVFRTPPKKPDTATYQFIPPFEPTGFATWLATRFPTGTTLDCAEHLAEDIHGRLLRADSVYIHCTYCNSSAPDNAPGKKDGTKPSPVQDKASGDAASAKGERSDPASAKDEGSDPAATKDANKPAKEKAGTTAKPTYLHLDNASTSLHPIFKKDTLLTDINKVDMLVIRDTPATVNDTIRLAVDRFKFPYAPEIRSQQPIILTKDQWHVDTITTRGDTTKRVAKIQLLLTNASIDTLADDAVAEIRIQDGDSSFHELRLTQKGLYIPNKPFWIELGANFDVSDGFKTNNLYCGIFLFKKDVMKLSRHAKKRIAILGGVYEAKTISSAVTSDSGMVFRDGRSYIHDTAGRYPIFRDTGAVGFTTTTNNVGMFFSPQFRLTNGDADQNGLHIFFSIWTEMLWQTVTTNYDYSHLDSVAGGSTTIYVPSIDSANKYQAKTQSFKQDFRSHYLGFGLPFFLKEGTANLYIHPVFGWTTQSFIPIPELGDGGHAVTRLDNKWRPFYLTQFRLSEEQYGFTFTGEVRGLFNVSGKPFITLAISKKFNLDKIGSYISSVLKF